MSAGCSRVCRQWVQAVPECSVVGSAEDGWVTWNGFLSRLLKLFPGDRPISKTVRSDKILKKLSNCAIKYVL